MNNEIKLNDLMGLERILLEIDIKYKFELSFNEAYLLYSYLKEIGRITNYIFLLQDEHYKKYGDAEKLRQYHDKLMEGTVEFNYEEITKFIDKVYNVYSDKEFETLVKNIRFWRKK